MKSSNKNLMLWAIVGILAIGTGVVVLSRTGGLHILSQVRGSSSTASVFGAFVQSNNFGILAGSTITNTGSSVIGGDLGLSPGTSITGFFGTVENDGPGTVSGSIHQTDATAASAQISLTAAYTDVAAQTCTHDLTGQDLGGMTLTPGTYCFSSSAQLTGVLTLDAGGDPNAVFVFQIATTLTTASASSIVFAGGIGSSCNVFWQVATSATLGSTTTFVGNILSLNAISTANATTVNGRLLARNAAVTLINTAVVAPLCTVPATATLHVIKLVVGGSAVASDFSVHVKNAGVEVGGGPFPGAGGLGTLYTLNQGSPYVVSEDSNSSYTASFTGCDSTGKVTLGAGDTICTIINTTNVIPPPVVVPVRTSGGGHPLIQPVLIPLIGILKVPVPLALPQGPGSVTYGYTVWNVAGQEPLVNVSVTDDKCASVTFVSGDTNSNSKLDPTEKWQYSCTMNLAATTTNTAIVTGYSDDAYHQAAIATAVATVVVGVTTTPPLINIIKVPSRLIPFPFGGGTVTYTYTVTNPGIVSIQNVSVSDDKCSPVSLLSGDTNNDRLLDVGEKWIYTCTMPISVSTRNVATVTGTANGFTAIGYAFATVLVAVPIFPNTGISPLGEIVQDVVMPDVSSGTIRIPKIGVDASLEAMSITADGSMEAPTQPQNAGLFKEGTVPGTIGSAVIAGHYGWKNGQGSVFDNLNKLQPGNKVFITDAQGVSTTFIVRKIQAYDSIADASDVFGSTDGRAHLNLVSCQGIWNKATGNYSERLVVFTDKI